MIQAFGDRAEQLVTLATQAFDATPFNQGDSSVLIKALPLVPLVLILWKGDEEFPPECQILYSSEIINLLPLEDVAVLAGRVAKYVIKWAA